MSRTSALTALRLIGSPTNPDWPYCCPWLLCAAILSLAGEIRGRGGGVGDGEGFCSPVTLSPSNCDATGTVDACLPNRANGARVVLASTKLFNNNAVMQTPTHFLAAANFRGLLSIIPSSGNLSKPTDTRYARNASNEHPKRAPHCAVDSVSVVKCE